MEYIYSAILLHKLGKPINEANVKHVLEAAGARVEETKVKAVVAALEGVDIESAMKEAAVTQIAAPTEAKAEKKEKAKEEKKSEEEAAAGLGSLFG